MSAGDAPAGALVPIAGTALAGDALVQALGSAAFYAEAEKAAATRRAYATDIALFAAWGRARGVDVPPASVALVAAYLASLADEGLRASTITRRCAAIADWHRRNGLEPPTSAEPVRAVLRGIRRTIGTRVTQKAPATDKVIVAILKRIPDTLIGRRDRALLLVQFAAALRRSELVELNVADVERLPDGVLLHIGRSKTDQEGVGQTVPIPRGGRLAVVERLDAWLASAGIVEGPLFRAVAKGGRVGERALSDHAVAVVMKDRAAAAGFDPALFSGHSARAGFVTTALEKGADVLKVMHVTRHASVETLKRYDRRAQAFRNHAGKGFL